MLGSELDEVTLVDIAAITRWGNTGAYGHALVTENQNTFQRSPFPYNQDINLRIAYWTGDVSLLNAHAVVCCNNEILNDNDKSTQRLLRRAGPNLRRDLVDNVRSCKTGEAKLTKAYQLPSRYIIHTVGPRYTQKYRTAAESALYNGYRSVLTILTENKLKSLGLRCIHSSRRGYPTEDGAHIALRTVRRFLERCPADAIDLIVFISTTPEEKEVYTRLLPLYYPRSEMEVQQAVHRLPTDVGNEWGEPVIAERTIRICANPARTDTPQSCDDGSVDDEEESLREIFNSSCSIGQHAFSHMETDVDTRRRQRAGTEHSDVQPRVFINRKTTYDRLLQRAKQENFSDLHQLRFLFQSGFDRRGRPVVVFIGKHYPALKLPREKVIPYFIKQLDSVVNSKYVIVFVHTLTDARNEVSSDCIRHLYQLVDERYVKNLEAIYMLHAGMWTKMSYWWLTTFDCPELKSRVEYLAGVEYLYARITVDQLDLPQFVIDYDYKTNGIRYYNEPDIQEVPEDQAGL